MNNHIKAKDLANQLGLYLKVVTSVKAFDNYNSFFNIYDQSDEPCRRIVVLTPYEDLEEVYDENPDEAITSPKLVDGSLWLEEYPLTTKPKNISLDEVCIDENLIKSLIDSNIK